MRNPQHPKPKFSIITVTYNARAVIQDTLQSVTSQTYPNMEYIFIDGLSTDDTVYIARQYADRINILLSEPDRGLYDAMNKGISLATGDYICFLNAGDTFHSNDTLQQIADTLQPDAPLPDVIYGETAIVDYDRNFLRMRRLSAPKVLTWKSFRQGMLVCHQAFFAKRTLAVPFDLRYCFSADFDWCIRVMKYSKTLHNTNLILIDYLEEGMTTRNRKISLRERFQIMEEHYGRASTIAYHAWFLLRAVLKR